MTETIQRDSTFATILRAGMLFSALGATGCPQTEDTAISRETGDGQETGSSTGPGMETETDTDTDTNTDTDMETGSESLGTLYAHFNMGNWTFGEDPNPANNGNISNWKFEESGPYAIQFSANPTPGQPTTTFILASEYTAAYGDDWGFPLYGFKVTSTQSAFPDTDDETMEISQALATQVFALISDDPKVKLTRPNPNSVGVLELTWDADENVWSYEGQQVFDDEPIEFKPRPDWTFDVVVYLENGGFAEHFGALYYSRDSDETSGALIGRQQLFPFPSQSPMPSATFPGVYDEVPPDEAGDRIFTVNIFGNASYRATTDPW